MRRTPEPRPFWLSHLRRAGRFLTGIPRPLAWALVFGWMGGVWWLSATTIDLPLPEDARWRPLFTNLGHAPLFGVLALLLAGALLGPSVSSDPASGPGALPVLSPTRALVIGLWAGTWGIVDEWHQSRVPGRDATVLDVATDLVGVLCTLWVVTYVLRADALELGTRRRLLVGVLLCLLAASVATFLPLS